MNDTRYKLSERVLHRIALGSPWLAEALFDVESRALGERQAVDVTMGRHVFVSGMARGGTTILMRLIHASGQYSSLTYDDMPFVMAPNLWARLRALSPATVLPGERAHGDRIIVDNQSPEALDEVFWRVYCQQQYLASDHLKLTEASDEVVALFRRYVDCILTRYGPSRYLSKNNNNIVRLSTIRRSFPAAVLLLPFRQPLTHANSLLRQHRFWSLRHREDPFSLKYMRFLAHHEFGADHRPFYAPASADKGEPFTIDYWLRQWLQVYERLLGQAESLALVPVCYERLCDAPDAFWQAFTRLAGLPDNTPLPDLTLSEPPASALPTADPDLLDRAESLYSLLAAMSENCLTAQRASQPLEPSPT